MTVMRGETEHYVPVATLKETGQDDRAYDWDNLRYADGWINQKKLTAKVLDPFDVEDGWFEINLPSMQLLPTNNIPLDNRELAAFTLKRLGLRDHEVIVRFRKEWFDMYRKGKLTIDGLKDVAPLIALAVERDLAQGIDWRLD